MTEEAMQDPEEYGVYDIDALNEAEAYAEAILHFTDNPDDYFTMTITSETPEEEDAVHRTLGHVHTHSENRGDVLPEGTVGSGRDNIEESENP